MPYPPKRYGRHKSMARAVSRGDAESPITYCSARAAFFLPCTGPTFSVNARNRSTVVNGAHSPNLVAPRVVGAAQLETQRDKLLQPQHIGHLDEAELGRACKHVAGDAYERSSGKRCGAHVAGDFPASAACRLARHDDVQGERDALELRHSGKLADHEFGDLAF